MFLLIFLLLLYILFPFPFILSKTYWDSRNFNIVFTSASCICLLLGVVNNGLLIHVLRKNPDILGPLNCYYIVMLLADLLFPWFYLPMGILFSWIHFNELWESIDFDVLVVWSRVLSSCLYSTLTLSINSFTVFCVLRVYMLYTRSTELKTRWKIFSCLFLIVITATMFSISQEYSDKKLSHFFISTFAAFLPFLICLLTVLLTLLLWCWRYNSQSLSVPKNKLDYMLLYTTLLSYFICWIPMFTISNVHMYHTRIEFEHYSKLTYVTPMLLILKSPCNILTAILSNKTVRKKMKKIVCCCMSSEEENNNEMCMYYTNTGGDELTSVVANSDDQLAISEGTWSEDTKVLIEE